MTPEKKLALACVVLSSLPSAARAVSIVTVSIGNPGNVPAHIGGRDYGGVNYTDNLSKFEVTAGQYCDFLNAVAGADAYGLYNPSMASTYAEWGCNIQRSGSAGSYVYNVPSDWADRPVNFVSWGDAARFANWMHNGQPNGEQTAATTEDGAYNLNGATSSTALMAVTRSPNATWVIPSDAEWYKAAYHKNDGATGNYFAYPTASNTAPANAVIDPDPGNSANYHITSYSIGGPYYRTVVGEFENSPSPYGTFDQGGNVDEWTEGVFTTQRISRGGSFYQNGGLNGGAGGRQTPTNELSTLGFRLAYLPAIVAADFNCDGHVDLADLEVFQACTTGPAIPYDQDNFPPTCSLQRDSANHIAADFDADGDVDEADFGVFQRCYSGPTRAPRADCAN